jgi:hypothetical protein
MLRCTACSGTLVLRETACDTCGVAYRGEFALPRLMRLAPNHLALAEVLVLSGGNLKALAGRLGISYPTLRKRVDELIAELCALREGDEARSDEILAGIESGAIPAAKGTRLIRELNGDL